MTSYCCDDMLDRNVPDDRAEQHGLQSLSCGPAEDGERQQETSESRRLMGRCLGSVASEGDLCSVLYQLQPLGILRHHREILKKIIYCPWTARLHVNSIILVINTLNLINFAYKPNVLGKNAESSGRGLF